MGRYRQTWIERLTEALVGPPWVRPRGVWHGDKQFPVLRDRLDFVRDINIRESLYRDRETDQLWRLCAVEGGGDMYPGTVDCFMPVAAQTER